MQEFVDNHEAHDAYKKGFDEGEAKKQAALKRARELGMKDGKAGKPVHKGEIATWPEVQTKGLANVEIVARNTLLHRLFEIYDAGLTAAAPAGVVPTTAGKVTAGEAVKRDARAAALKKAHALGTGDGKAGKTAHIDEIRTWPEVQTKGLNEAESAARMTLLHELLDTYHSAFKAAAPPGSISQKPSSITAGEAVKRDEKAAGVKRAFELGGKDGNVGKPLHQGEIQTWPEVQTAGLTGTEVADRMTLLHTLLEAYNKGFAKATAASASSRTAPSGPPPSREVSKK